VVGLQIMDGRGGIRRDADNSVQGPGSTRTAPSGFVKC
jgi:hypothetical protein